MKKKKLLISAVAAVSVLGSAQSAFAISGIADTLTNPIPLGLGSNYSSYVDYMDGDWFSYTNTTSSNVSIIYGVYPNSYSSGANFDVTALLQDPSGNYIPIGTLSDNGAGYGDYGTGSLAPGFKIIWRVFGHSGSDYGSSKPYTAYVSRN
ncbi:hypothetical protein ACFFSY_15215 [Paenibacillus aurantiacus]|uniref:Uncharacterized protein n=1 Tax=Paenibacillus aurantiacus TaxID=1936118 RepID=A0ABV5KPZ0_9BACL